MSTDLVGKAVTLATNHRQNGAKTQTTFFSYIGVWGLLIAKAEQQ